MEFSCTVPYKISICVSLITLHTSRCHSKVLPCPLKHRRSDFPYTRVRYQWTTSKSRNFFLSERNFAKSLQKQKKIQWWEFWTSWRPHPQPRTFQSSDWEIRHTGYFLNHEGTCSWNEVSILMCGWPCIVIQCG